MFLVQQITSDAYQKQRLILEDGTALDLVIYFRPMQLGWFIQDLIYGDFILHGLRITNSPNMLNQFRNLIPFGLACFCDQNREPTQLQDFSSGAAKLYILDASETALYAELLQNG